MLWCYSQHVRLDFKELTWIIIQVPICDVAMINVFQTNVFQEASCCMSLKSKPRA
jgi:hypothetical protein